MSLGTGHSIGTLTASTDLSAKQYFAVKVSGEKTATVADATATDVIGILENKPESGSACTIRTQGHCRGSAGGSISADDLLKTDASGELVTASSSDKVIGRALEDASDGDIFELYLFGNPLAAAP